MILTVHQYFMVALLFKLIFFACMLMAVFKSVDCIKRWTGLLLSKRSPTQKWQNLVLLRPSSMGRQIWLQKRLKMIGRWCAQRGIQPTDDVTMTLSVLTHSRGKNFHPSSANSDIATSSPKSKSGESTRIMSVFWQDTSSARLRRWIVDFLTHSFCACLNAALYMCVCCLAVTANLTSFE